MAYSILKTASDADRMNFIVTYNHNQHLRIEESENYLWALEDDEILNVATETVTTNPDYISDLKALKLKELNEILDSFNNTRNSSVYFTSSLNFKMPGDNSEKLFLEKNIQCFNINASSGSVTIYDFDGSARSVTLEGLNTLLAELIVNKNNLTIQGNTYRATINAAVTEEEIIELQLNFTMSNFYTTPDSSTVAVANSLPYANTLHQSNIVDGSLFLYDATKTYTVNAVVMYSNKLWVCLQTATAQTPAAGSAYWKEITSSDRTGTIKAVMDLDDLDNGWILAQGGTYSRTTYKDLWEYANDNNLVRDTEAISDLSTYEGLCYGPGDGSTTFSVPDLRGRVFMGASTAHAVGHYVKEQLPNIKGRLKTYNDTLFLPSNAFSIAYAPETGIKLGGSGSYQQLEISFDAHNADSIYADSGKVYPLSLALNFIIKC